jgi:meso-butanediol dehydrogenase / (S,S)-butanediol dehydrogenase / diacetyl reductase
VTSQPGALITGGGSGIGAATARRLAAAGYSVCVTGRQRGPLEEIAAEVGGLAVVADTGDARASERAVEAAVERFGGLAVLVCSAGTGASGAVSEQTPERWSRVIETNLTGAFLACRAALPELVESRGAVVTVASLAGLRAGPESAAYGASKAGLIMLTQSIALDYGPRGVRANCVCPGWIRTPMADAEMDELAERTGGDREAAYELANRLVPSRRPGTPEEAAEAIAWLASPASSYVNGAVLPVDGGSAIVDVASAAFEVERSETT